MLLPVISGIIIIKRGNVRIWTCASCEESFQTRALKNKHFQEIHGGGRGRGDPVKLRICQFCGKEWDTTNSGLCKHEKYCLKNQNRSESSKKGIKLTEEQKAARRYKPKPRNTYDLSGEYGIGYTKNGKQFLFDLEDFDKIKSYNWHISNEGYVRTNPSRHDKLAKKVIYFHQIVMDCEENDEIDHRNHNTADNQKSNLRFCTQQQNNRNKKAKGYCWDPRNRKWMAYIKVDRKSINLGRFDTEDAAKQARKEAEIKYFSDFRYNPTNSESIL